MGWLGEAEKVLSPEEGLGTISAEQVLILTYRLNQLCQRKRQLWSLAMPLKLECFLLLLSFLSASLGLG